MVIARLTPKSKSPRFPHKSKPSTWRVFCFLKTKPAGERILHAAGSSIDVLRTRILPSQWCRLRSHARLPCTFLGKESVLPHEMRNGLLIFITGRLLSAHRYRRNAGQIIGHGVFKHRDLPPIKKYSFSCWRSSASTAEARWEFEKTCTALGIAMSRAR